MHTKRERDSVRERHRDSERERCTQTERERQVFMADSERGSHRLFLLIHFH